MLNVGWRGLGIQSSDLCSRGTASTSRLIRALAIIGIEMTRDATCSGERQLPHADDLALGMHKGARCEEELQ